mmetsp:Transcript_83244/g.230989  ORF Transcript_83244/g.230989 Transcript_83244/m.230989 type:complete len:259 (-) Transcript_83244:619-1395(-)
MGLRKRSGRPSRTVLGIRPLRAPLSAREGYAAVAKTSPAKHQLRQTVKELPEHCGSVARDGPAVLSEARENSRAFLSPTVQLADGDRAQAALLEPFQEPLQAQHAPLPVPALGHMDEDDTALQDAACQEAADEIAVLDHRAGRVGVAHDIRQAPLPQDRGHPRSVPAVRRAEPPNTLLHASRALELPEGLAGAINSLGKVLGAVPLVGPVQHAVVSKLVLRPQQLSERCFVSLDEAAHHHERSPRAKLVQQLGHLLDP